MGQVNLVRFGLASLADKGSVTLGHSQRLHIIPVWQLSTHQTKNKSGPEALRTWAVLVALPGFV